MSVRLRGRRRLGPGMAIGSLRRLNAGSFVVVQDDVLDVCVVIAHRIDLPLEYPVLLQRFASTVVHLELGPLLVLWDVHDDDL